MTAPKRDIIYIDIEDEITAVIDKVVSAKPTIIALVPPKRAPILQSIVNMKLLKRRADQAGKKLVLVTSESGLMPLAAMSKIHVAKNLQSKPAIPKLGSEADKPEDVQEADTPVGDLAAASETEDVPEAPSEEDVPDDVNLDEPTEQVPEAEKRTKKDKVKGPKIPNFNTFRTKLMLLAGGLILLIFGWYFMYRVFPRGSVVVKAETTRVNVASPFTAKTDAKTDEIDKGIIVAENKSVQKTLSQEFATTGTKNTGNKAAGTMTIRNCDYPDGFTVAAGTKFTEASGKVFVSSSAVNVPAFSGPSSGCNLSGGNSGKADVNVQANDAGDTYNLAARSYSIAGISGKVDALGGQMSGGTTQNVKVVSQEDVDGAKQKIANQDTNSIKDELKNTYGDDYVTVENSFANTQGEVKITPAVGEPGDNAKYSVVITYTLLGMKKTSFKQFVQQLAQKQYDQTKQKVFDDGVKSASIKVDKKLNDQNYTVTVNTDVYVGPQIEEASIAKLVSGRRVGEAEELIRKLPGVRDVKVSLSPFYAKKLPKPSKINVTFDVQATNQTP